MKHVAIVGGGIAGLTAAFYLQRFARDAGIPVRFTLLEQADRLGGKIVTERLDGFIVEGGPDSFINQKPHGLQLCRDLGLESELLPSNDSTYRTRLLSGGRMVPFPDGFRLAVPTKMWPFLRSPLLSWPGKIRMGFDFFIPRRRDPADESLAQFVTRRLGREALERIAGPIMSGIYVSDPDRMSVHSTFPMFVELERRYGSLIRGILKARRAAAHQARGGASPSIFTSLRNGMDTIVKAIRSTLEGSVLTGVRVGSVAYAGGAYRLGLGAGGVSSEIEADALILATPALEAARLVDGLHPGLAQALRGIRYVSSAVVSMAFPVSAFARCPDGGGFGLVLPKREPGRIMAMTWSDRKFDGRAPSNFGLLRVFIGGARNPELAELPENDLLALAREELSSLFGIDANPLFSKVFKWSRGNPQFDVGHLERVAGMERMAAEITGFHLVGGAYRGVGIPDCTKGAIHAARSVLGLVEHVRHERTT